MIQCVNTAVLQGIEAVAVKVECDVSDGLPSFEMVGYLSNEVKEAEQRVKSALKNSGYKLASKRIIVNFSPASIKKTGTGFDLPVLLGVAAAYGLVKSHFFEKFIVAGEVSLTGKILPINGTLSIVSMAKSNGYAFCIVPKENYEEACLQPGIKIVGVENVSQLLEVINNNFKEIQRYNDKKINIMTEEEPENDFSEVYGNELAKRAILVAVSGMHNLLFIGPPGSGKTMLAQRIPGIMPEMTMEEAIEVTKIYSVKGLAGITQGISKRPFRNPHHTATGQSLIGGGGKVKPGEVSLAHRGVLFLDELPEFQIKTLEALREPLEEGRVHISRVHGDYIFPSRFMLVAAMNPCPCGYYPDFSRCNCTQTAIRRYLGKISGPMLDRIDLCVEVAEVKFSEFSEKPKRMSSKVMRKEVLRVRKIQEERFKGGNIKFNSEMTGEYIKEYCALPEELNHWMKMVFEQKKMSVRAYHRVLKVARTIADLSGHKLIEKTDLEEALLYRSLDKKYWER